MLDKLATASGCGYDLVVSMDTTFKISKQGYSLVVFGVIDRQQQFHTVAVALISKLTTVIYRGFLQDVVKFAQDNGVIGLNPAFAVIDGEVELRNALKAAFISMCYFQTDLNVSCCNKQGFQHSLPLLTPDSELEGGVHSDPVI